MTIQEIREWAESRPKRGTKEYGFVHRSKLESYIDTLLSELNKTDDLLLAAYMSGAADYKSKLRTATEALERIASGSCGLPYQTLEFAAAALKGIKEAGNE